MKHAALKPPAFWTGALALLAAVALAGTAQAQRGSSVTAGKLAQLCVNKSEAARAACDAYIDGVEGAVGVYQFLRPRDGSKGQPLPASAYICIPNGTTANQMREEFVAWAKRHPDEMDRSAPGIVLRALRDTYPCAGSSGAAKE